MIAAALAIDGLGGDARGAFEIASRGKYHGIAFATNHAELMPDKLGQSARRHLKTILSGKQLEIDAIRVAGPRGGFGDAGTIDRMMENARKGILLAADLGVGTVSMNVGNLVDSKVPTETVVAAIRELAQHADAVGRGKMTLTLGGDVTGVLGGILKAVDYERAKVNLDTARMIGAGEDALKVAEDLGGMIGELTAADVVRAGKSVRAVYLGEGQVALPELMEILEEQGFGGPVVVDVRDLSDGAEGAEHAAGVLRALMR